MSIPTAARPNAGLTDLDPATLRYLPHFRSGRMEIVSVRSADGVWLYERQEDVGTSWIVTHIPTGRSLDFEPSLRLARIGTLTGWTLRQLDRQSAPIATTA